MPKWKSARRACLIRSTLFWALALLYTALIFGSPIVIVGTMFVRIHGPLARDFVLLIAPLLSSFVFVSAAGCCSLPHQRGIVAGIFPRKLDHPVYFHRRLYGLCWCYVYYCPLVYQLFLALPMLKAILFRLFGYRGQMRFTIYPDTWLRDLPLLDFGSNTYIANKATIGTNMPQRKGTILVGPISVGANSVIGHLTMLAPGVRVGSNVEVGVGCGIGINTSIRDGVRIGPVSILEHGITVEEMAVVGIRSLICTKAVVQAGVTLPSGSFVPPRSVVGSSGHVVRTKERRYDETSQRQRQLDKSDEEPRAVSL